MSEKGALFPWRTIDGEEASAYYPAGTAQYHIDADIVYAMEKYCEATGDTAFLNGSVAEVALETARLEELPGGRTRLRVQELMQSPAERDAQLGYGLADNVRAAYARLDALLAALGEEAR